MYNVYVTARQGRTKEETAGKVGTKIIKKLSMEDRGSISFEAPTLC